MNADRAAVTASVQPPGPEPPDGWRADMGDQLASLYRRAVAAADQVDTAAEEGRISPRLVPGGWAALKLAASGLLAPLWVPWWATRAGWNFRQVRRLVKAWPRRLERVGAGIGDPIVARVARAPARARWFIVSDLHRGPAGRLDWPARQDSRAIYDAALGLYDGDGWGLIENGDIDEFWLVGGSAYGAVYDLGRMVAALLPGRAGVQLRRAVYEGQVERIGANYRETSARVERFADTGRYFRTVGNHDDPYLDRSLVAAAARRQTGLDLVDCVVLVDDDRPVAYVCHGHQTDSWSGPGLPNAIGKINASLGAAVADIRWSSVQPGLPSIAESRAVIDEEIDNHLTELGPLLGTNPDYIGLDERLLFESWRSYFGAASNGDVEEGPWLLMGHTHKPLHGPRDRRSGGRWRRYLNSGSGIGYQLQIGIEWDGTRLPADDPEARVVAWSPATEDTASEHRVHVQGGADLVRHVLEPTPDGSALTARPVAARPR